MTSRERVRAVLEHRVPDRVPNGLGGHESGGLHVMAYENLLDVLGLKQDYVRLNSFLGNAVFEEEAIRAMEGDTILISALKLCDSDLRGDVLDQWKPQSLWGRTYLVPRPVTFRVREDGGYTWHGKGWFDGLVCPKGAYYFDRVDPMDLFSDFEVPDPDDYKPADSFSDETLRKLEDTAKRLYEETDLSLSIGEGLTTLQVQPGGYANYMVLLMEEPDIMRAILDNFVNACLSQLKQLDQAVGKYVDMVSCVLDIGDNRGVMIGAPLWREIYKPAFYKLFHGWKDTTRMACNFHSCGSVAEIMPDLIECGLQILNPIQTSAAGMDVKSMKSKYGRDVILWGGAYDAQLVSPEAGYDEVYRAVRENIHILAEGGNYIFSGVHNLPATMPRCHIKAMMDAFFDERAY